MTGDGDWKTGGVRAWGKKSSTRGRLIKSKMQCNVVVVDSYVRYLPYAFISACIYMYVYVYVYICVGVSYVCEIGVCFCGTVPSSSLIKQTEEVSFLS